MNLKGLNINGLISRLPIVQGGMGIGVSLSKLASAVAREGGVGVISAAHPGFNRPGFSLNPLKTNLEWLAYHIKEAKKNAANGIIGVNIMCVSAHYDRYVKCCIDSGADLIISGAGLPINLPELVEGSAIKIAPIISPVKAVKVLL
ncbi:MAG: nitronate monooxygenase, partial [Clostridiales bacterium]|nr:nitronate monooxygenase [Clostridiales bacterium]